MTDDLAALEPWSLTGSEVREVAVAVQRARTSLDAALSRLARCADDMALPKDDGATGGRFVIPDTDADTLRAAIEGIIAPRHSMANASRLGMTADDYAVLPRDQKMGHAFTELINHLPTEALLTAGGPAATVPVTIGIDDLRTGQGVAANTSGTTMSATKARRLACNAHRAVPQSPSRGRKGDSGTRAQGVLRVCRPGCRTRSIWV